MLALVNLLPVPASVRAVAGADVDPLLVEQADIVLPVPVRGSVKLRADPLKRTLELELPLRQGGDPTFELQKALAAIGGRLLEKSRRGARIRWMVELPYFNLQARLLPEPQGKRVRVRVGSGRVLAPENGAYPYHQRRGVPAALAASLREEGGRAPHDPGAARARLLRLASKGGDAALLAALEYADRLVRAQDLDGAAQVLRATLARAMRQAPQLAPLARWRIAAYCQNVFQPMETFLPGDEAAYPAWVREEVRFAQTRLAFARGDMEAALRSGIALFLEHPDSAFAPEVRPLLEEAHRRRILELERDDRPAEIAMAALDYLHGVPALPLETVRREVERAAEALLAADLPALAAQDMLWLLRTRGAGALTSNGAILLAEALFAQGDLDRTAKTLALYDALPRGAPEPRPVLLRGKLAEARGRPEEAVEFYRQVLVLDPGSRTALEAARRGASLLRAMGRGVDAYHLVRQGLPAAGDRRPEAADFLALSGDMAYEAGLTEAAARAYHDLLRRFPKDERIPAVRYRLTRLGAAPGPLRDEGDSVWTKAASLRRTTERTEEKTR